MAVDCDDVSGERSEIDPELARGRPVDDPKADPPAALDAHDLRIGEGPIVGEERIEINVIEVHVRRPSHGHLHVRQLGGAVRAMLEAPARTWSLNELAARANASRASFVRMFQGVAQRAPLEFLTELRLELASRKLRTTSLPLADVAAEAGYQSESSFSRAFRRRFGRPPGALRAGQT
jgi:transcriptional regulator GlxA family with amidase domain